MTLTLANQYYRLLWTARGLWTIAALLLLGGFYLIWVGAYPTSGHGGGGHATLVMFGTIAAAFAVLAGMVAFYCVQRAKSLAADIRSGEGVTTPPA